MFFHLFNIPRDLESDSEDDVSETLLPSTSSSILSSNLRDGREKRRNRELYIALKIFILTSAVYLVVGVVIIFSGMFNGTFLHENIYRQPEGPEVDKAWEGLGVDYRPIILPSEEAEKSGLRPDQVKVQESFGGGYIANVEGLHHLHCLNVLRKSLKWNYDYYVAQKKPPFSNSEGVVRFHVTHCLDVLRQQLMCVPDIGVLGQVWWQPENEVQPIPFVDFNTKHRCRDFEGVRQWTEAHQLPPEEDVDMDHFYQMPKPGDIIYPEIP
ncbi:hypothetical protein N0V90_011014 [Kalmusia sp. IMI 367209]|nr:hypothetical protein N0V90_011014 [Kalmusia sp. IMI 367209]